jgi:hypothetical protein
MLLDKIFVPNAFAQKLGETKKKVQNCEEKNPHFGGWYSILNYFG